MCSSGVEKLNDDVRRMANGKALHRNCYAAARTPAGPYLKGEDDMVEQQNVRGTTRRQTSTRVLHKQQSERRAYWSSTHLPIVKHVSIFFFFCHLQLLHCLLVQACCCYYCKFSVLTPCVTLAHRLTLLFNTRSPRNTKKLKINLLMH